MFLRCKCLILFFKDETDKKYVQRNARSRQLWRFKKVAELQRKILQFFFLRSFFFLFLHHFENRNMHFCAKIFSNSSWFSFSLFLLFLFHQMFIFFKNSWNFNVIWSNLVSFFFSIFCVIHVSDFVQPAQEVRPEEAEVETRCPISSGTNKFCHMLTDTDERNVNLHSLVTREKKFGKLGVNMSEIILNQFFCIESRNNHRQSMRHRFIVTLRRATRTLREKTERPGFKMTSNVLDTQSFWHQVTNWKSTFTNSKKNVLSFFDSTKAYLKQRQVVNFVLHVICNDHLKDAENHFRQVSKFGEYSRTKK